MKRTIKLAVVAALALGATSAFATNGDNLIGLGAKARGMAGTGIGMNHGAESALLNPAFIDESEISFGGTVFMPDVNMKNTAITPDGTGGMQTTGTSYASSASDLSVIPEVAITIKVNNNFSWGIGMYGVAGMGVDYRDDNALFQGGDESKYLGTKSGTNQMLTNLQLMRFAVPLAYHMDNFSVAFSPILQYGSLDIAYNAGQSYKDSSNTSHNTMTGRGVSQDFGLGYNIGLSYEIQGLTLGAVYTSAINMTYDHQISDATKQFGLNQGRGLSDDLEQPAEIGAGASYKFGGSTVAIDYKRIKWSSANGYEDFKWDDQNVVAIGYEYATKGWALRAGYNYASNPIQEQKAASMATDYDGAVINYFNAAGFPATTESHYAIGGTYNISDMIGVDFAYTYAPKVTESYDTSALTQAQVYGGALAQGATQQQAGGAAAASSSKAHVTHSQQGVTLAMTIKF
jgi:long-chain fatty acid transport protein